MGQVFLPAKSVPRPAHLAAAAFGKGFFPASFILPMHISYKIQD